VILPAREVATSQIASHCGSSKVDENREPQAKNRASGRDRGRGASAGVMASLKKTIKRNRLNAASLVPSGRAPSIRKKAMSTEPGQVRARCVPPPKPNGMRLYRKRRREGGCGTSRIPLQRDGNRRHLVRLGSCAANSVRIPRRFRWPSWALIYGVLGPRTHCRETWCTRSRE